MKIDTELTIASVGRRGDGVGDWQERPVFVPRTLPGEVVTARLREDRDQGIAGQLLEIITPAADRVAAPCPHYEICGGCALQHWAPESYRGWKAERVRDLLDRAGLVPDLWRDPVFISAGTRRRATLAAVLENNRLRFGYHRARSHDIADIESCMVLTEMLRLAAQALRPYLEKLLIAHKPAAVFLQDTGGALDVMITGGKEPGYEERETMAEMARACNIARLCRRAGERDEPEIIVQHKPVTKKAGALSVTLPPGAFMQPSAEGEAALVDAVLAPLQKSGAQKIADLFSGCGTFTGPLLALGSVSAYESEGSSILALQKTGADHLTAARRNLFSDPLTAKELAPFDAVVLDPPRMGAKEQAGALADSDVPLIVSVSCNPATFVRDAKMLCDGGYHFESAQLIDQFTWSSHIEMVGVFTR